MSSISSVQTTTELPTILGNFIDACVVNRLATMAQSIEPQIEDYFQITRTENSSHWVADDDKAKAAEEQKKKKEQEYLKIKNGLPETIQKQIDEVTSKLDAIKKIAEILCFADKSLYNALATRRLEPLEAVESCIPYINSLVEEEDVCSVLRVKYYHMKDGVGSCRYLYITTVDPAQAPLKIKASSVVIRVKPETEFYLLYDGNEMHHIKMTAAESDGTRDEINLSVDPCEWELTDEQLALLKSHFESELVTKNTLIGGPDNNIVVQIPQPMKISSFVKACKFWEEDKFDEVRYFFTCRIEGREEESILPEDLVNGILKDYIVSP